MILIRLRIHFPAGSASLPSPELDPVRISNNLWAGSLVISVLGVESFLIFQTYFLFTWISIKFELDQDKTFVKLLAINKDKNMDSESVAIDLLLLLELRRPLWFLYARCIYRCRNLKCVCNGALFLSHVPKMFWETILCK